MYRVWHIVWMWYIDSKHNQKKKKPGSIQNVALPNDARDFVVWQSTSEWTTVNYN